MPVDREVCSSGELTVSYSRAVKDHLLIGENTAGIAAFGDVREYVLPNSNIRLHLPSSFFWNPE